MAQESKPTPPMEPDQPEHNPLGPPQPKPPEQSSDSHHGQCQTDEFSMTNGKRTHRHTGYMYSWTYALTFAILAFIGIFTIPLVPFAFAGGWILGHLWWKNFCYFIDEDGIRTERQFFGQHSRRVPFARVEGADIHQPSAIRSMGLAELRIESAGGPDSEIKIAYISLAEAQFLRALVLERSHALRAKTHAPAATDSVRLLSIQSLQENLGELKDLSAPIDNPYDEERVLVGKASNTDIVFGALLSNWTLGGVLFAVGALPIAITLGALGASSQGGISSWLAFSGFLLLFGTLALPFYTVTYWNFELTRGRQGLAITYGLLNRISHTIPLDRIQGVRLTQPLLWRPFGRCKVVLNVAGYESGSEKQDLDIRLWPIGKLDFAYALVNQVLIEPAPEQHVLNATHGSSRGVLFAPIGWRHRWLTRSATTVQSVAGWATKTVQIAGQRKVQSVEVTQGPIQRVFRLASISLHVPDGPVSIQLKNFNAEEAMPLLSAEVRELRAAMESDPSTRDRPQDSGISS